MVRLPQEVGGGSRGSDASGGQGGSGGGTGSFYSTAADKAESKIRYQDSLLDSVADAIIATDLNLAITTWNKGAEKIYGWTSEEALGKNVIDFLKTQFRASTPDDVLARLSREGSVRGEVSQVCKDGRAIDVKGSTSVVEVGGTHVGYVSIGIDITEIRRAEEALKESEETFRSLFESTPIALFEIDASRVVAKITSISSSAAELIARTAGERRDILAELLSSLDVKAVNKRSIELFEASGKDELLSHLGYVLTDDTAIKLVEGMATMMTGSTHFAGEAEAKTLRGKEIYVSVDVSPAVSSEVAPTRFVVAFNELTRIKKAEAELRTVASLPEENPSPVLRLASDGIISYSNPAGMAILQAWGSKVGGLAPEVWRKTVREVLAEKRSRIMDMEHGGVFYSVSVAPFHEGGYVNLYARDITERKRAEKKLKTYSRRLEGLVQDRTAELEETHRALLEAEGLAATGRVSTQLAHDLRNPLAGIKMESYVLNELLAKSLDPRARDTLRLLSDSATHAGKVIEDLLEYTRLQEPFRRQLELGACIADVVAAFPIPKGVSLVVKKAPKAHVLAEQGQLVKVVRSLLDNAVDAMPHGGKLTISFQQKTGAVAFSVEDTGVGISKRDLPEVFMPFYTTKAKGLGLGLPIARKIVEAHGGSMELKSTLGKGTKVTVILRAV